MIIILITRQRDNQYETINTKICLTKSVTLSSICIDDVEDVKDEVQSDLSKVMKALATDSKGVMVHASTLGALEALLQVHHNHNHSQIIIIFTVLYYNFLSKYNFIMIITFLLLLL